MRVSAGLRRWIAIVCAVALTATMAGIVPASAAPGARKAPPPDKRPKMRVTTASGEVLASKMDVKLRAMVEAAEGDPAKGNAEVDVAVAVKKGAPKPAGMTKALKLRLHTDALGDMYVGTAKVRTLVKLASGKDVSFVYENGRRTAPIVPDSGGGGRDLTRLQKRLAIARNKARLAAAREAGAITTFVEQFDEDGVLKDPIDYEGGSATGWHDVTEAGHNSVGAWNMGYTGDGVRIAVADDSCDFAHPDLMGTWATVEDPSSPYHGWPMAFDPYSCLLYAYDAYYGTSFVADGDTWFSDTSATVEEPGGEFDGKTVFTPGTSQSGTYHIGYLWDENYYEYGFDEYPLVLVADENEPGVYDTVYVDLDDDYDFSTDKPCTMASPVSYADWHDEDYNPGPDGFADVSGGMIYWIADGENQPPGVEFMFGGAPSTPGAGEMVCFMGALNLDEDHGTLCSSNVVGQGMTDWASVLGEYPHWRIPQPGTGDGIVQGAAKDGDLVAIADIYWSHFTSTIAAYDFAAFGYDWVEKSGDEVQVVSNSYGESDEDADGWDYRSRYITDTNVNWNDEVSYLFSTGNGAPGYGTNAPPSAATAIAVGASTQMGACGGWDSAYDEDQITVGDVIPWSNRGPNASGGLAPDIVADGAYSSGAVPLNMYVYNGASSWEIWGGTSRSCPVAAGNLALVYQAYADTHGGAWPTYAQAKQFLQNGARDLNYDVLVQGAGSIDAGRSAALAAESGGLSVTPSMWLPGDFAGEAYDSFVRTVHAGDSVSQRFIVRNTGEYPVNAVTSDAWYQRSGEMTMTLTLDSSRESKYDFNRPDCLVDLTNNIPPGTDLMVIRTTEDIADFAPTGEFTNANMDGATTHNVTRLLVYDWKDQDADGALWDDTDANGHVNIGEIDNGEYMRFTYHNNFGNTHEVRVQTPLERMHDGVYLGLQHRYRTPADPTTAVNVEISFWDRVDMPWLTGFMGAALGPDGWADFYSTLHVPADAPPGVYQGEIRVTDGTNVTVVPVVINVAADDYAFEFGQKAGEVADLMPNGTVFGGQDWNWRAESGDWRFFWTDGTAADELPDGAAWLVHTTWPDRGAAQGYDTDIDTLLYGPYLDEFSEMYPEVFGPYGLSKTGGSANTNLSAGIWTFQTNSGTTDEWVAGPLAAGANQVMVHNVLYDGLGIGTPFEGETGVISVDPSKIMVVSKEGTGTTQVAFNTYDLGLTGASASAYGLTRRVEATHQISQGEWWWDTIELTKAAYLDVRTACEGQDIDLYVWYSGDGGTTWSLVAASETSTGDEHVRIEMPPDGLYEIDVYGYSVSGTQPFDLVISSPMGDDMTLSGLPGGPVPAGSGFTLGIDWTKMRTTFEEREGTFEGVVFLGPTEAPSAVQVPVALRYPFYVESSDPAAGALVRDTGQSITVSLSKRLADSVKLDDDSVWLMKGGTDPVECDLSYDATAAVITVDPVDPLEWGSEYDLHLSLRSRDGDQMNRTIVFSTNAAPVAADDAYTVSANVTTTVDAPGVLSNDTDAEGDALTATLVSGPAHGALDLCADGGFAYRPAAGFVGADTFTYKASDGAADSNVATVTITVSPIAVTRVEGTSRVLTAIEASKKAFPAGAPAVVIATGYNWPDALGGAALAGAVEGPVLLTLPKTLPAEVAAEIARLGAHKAYILGGASAVGADVEAALRKQLGSANVKRIAGRDRYETARKTAAECVSLLGGAYDGTAFVATGLNFPDALGASPLAAAKGWPIYLVDPAKGADATLLSAMRAARVTRVVVLGGTKVVPAKVESDLKSTLPATTVRRAGDNRYQTAIKVASFGVAEGLSWDRLAIATGENFPDALAGGVLQGKGGSVMLLTPAARLDGDVAATLAANKASVSEVRFLGGTNALSAAVRTAVLNALK